MYFVFVVNTAVCIVAATMTVPFGVLQLMLAKPCGCMSDYPKQPFGRTRIY